MRSIVFSDVANNKWKRWYSEGDFSIPIKPVFDSSDVVFTIGSCFAAEVRTALTNRSVKCLPDYGSVKMSDDRYKIDTLPKQLHMNYYNTFAIRQEFERCVGEWQPEDGDVWEVSDSRWGGDSAYQDPYRRAVFGRTKDDLLEAISLASDSIRSGFERATSFFITLGLTEVWKKKNNGLIACQEPGYAGGGGQAETEFYQSRVNENLTNVVKCVELINHHKGSDTPIVITVSPVPLATTWSGNDIFSANTYSKSTLRTVAGEVSDLFQNVTYFPSYEIVTAVGRDAFRDDGRHVNPNVVAIIMDAFLKAHMRE